MMRASMMSKAPCPKFKSLQKAVIKSSQNDHWKIHHVCSQLPRKTLDIENFQISLELLFFSTPLTSKKKHNKPITPGLPACPPFFFLGGQIAQLRGPGFFWKSAPSAPKPGKPDSTEGRQKKRRFGSAKHCTIFHIRTHPNLDTTVAGTSPCLKTDHI